MSDEEVKALIGEIEAEFHKLEEFVLKVYRYKKSRPDIIKLNNLFRGLNDWAKKPKVNPFLHPAKILNYQAKTTESELTKKDLNTVARAVGNLRWVINEDSKSYYRTDGQNSNIRLDIESAQRGGRYRLRALINDDDFVHIVWRIKKQKTSGFDEALKSPYSLLSPIETVLQSLPTHPDFARPKFFRKPGPLAVDIEKGRVYVPLAVDQVIDALSKKGAVLLHGIAVSGKTVVARVAAHRWFKTGKKVRFVHLKTDFVDPLRLVEETTKFGKEEPEALLVLEDAHLHVDVVNQFLSRRTQDWPKILVTSLEPLPELPNNVIIDYFESLYSIPLQQYNLAHEIVRIFFKIKNWKYSEMLKDKIITVSKDNLWLLSYALRALEKTDGRKISFGSMLEEMHKDHR